MKIFSLRILFAAVTLVAGMLFLPAQAQACTWVCTSIGCGCADNKDIYAGDATIISVTPPATPNYDSDNKAQEYVAPPTVTQYIPPPPPAVVEQLEKDFRGDAFQDALASGAVVNTPNDATFSDVTGSGGPITISGGNISGVSSENAAQVAALFGSDLSGITPDQVAEIERAIDNGFAVDSGAEDGVRVFGMTPFFGCNNGNLDNFTYSGGVSDQGESLSGDPIPLSNPPSYTSSSDSDLVISSTEYQTWSNWYCNPGGGFALHACDGNLNQAVCNDPSAVTITIDQIRAVRPDCVLQDEKIRDACLSDPEILTAMFSPYFPDNFCGNIQVDGYGGTASFQVGTGCSGGVPEIVSVPAVVQIQTHDVYVPPADSLPVCKQGCTQACGDGTRCINGTCLNPNCEASEQNAQCVCQEIAQCISINQSPVPSKVGDATTYTCTEVPNAERYEFRVGYVTSKTSWTGVAYTDLDPKTADSNESKLFTFAKPGRYMGQCRPCFANNKCDDWDTL